MSWPRGKPQSAETRAKISAAKLGKPHSAETRAKISAANRGKKRSRETRAKAALAVQNRSPETRAKASAAMAAAAARALAAKHGIPVELVEDFRLYRRKRFTVAEAKAALGVTEQAA